MTDNRAEGVRFWFGANMIDSRWNLYSKYAIIVT